MNIKFKVILISITVGLIVILLECNSVMEFIGTLLVFVVFLFFMRIVVSLEARKDGWRDLDKEFSTMLAVTVPNFYDGFGMLNKMTSTFHVNANEDGIFVKLIWFASFRNNPIFIPWVEIYQLNFRKSLTFKRQDSIFAKLESKIQDVLFLELQLKKLKNLTLIIPWSEEINHFIPKNMLESDSDI